jgi:hypothetical protein
MKQGVIFLLVILITLPLQGQVPATSARGAKQVSRIGLQMGINLPKQVFTTITDENLYPDFDSPARFTAGFFSESGAFEYFVTQFGVFYSSGGYKIGDHSLRLDYLQVPVIMNFRTPIAGPVFLQAGLGPYFGFAFNGIMKTGDTIERDILSIPGDNISENKPYSFFDGGLVFGGSVEWVLPTSQILKLGVSYNLGIFKVSNKHIYMMDDGDGGFEGVELNTGAKNRIFSIHLSYLLDLKR